MGDGVVIDDPNAPAKGPYTVLYYSRRWTLKPVSYSVGEYALGTIICKYDPANSGRFLDDY